MAGAEDAALVKVKADIAAVQLWPADRRAPYDSPYAVYVRADAVEFHCAVCDSTLVTDSALLEAHHGGGRNLLHRFHTHCRKDGHEGRRQIV